MNKQFSLNDLANEIHSNAIAHGWYDKTPSLPECFANFHAEISEAFEEYRNGKPLVYDTCALCPDHCPHYGECDSHDPSGCKPQGVAVELCDAIIRILDTLVYNGIDVTALILAKHRYNTGRPYRHGGKVL